MVRFSLILKKISYRKRNLPLHTCIVGFQYARGRIQAAIYRRELGRPAATFPAIFPSFQFAQYAGGSNPSPERSTRGLPPAPADGSNYHHGNSYGAAAPIPWNSPQPQAAQFPGQNTYSRPSEPASPPHAGALGGYASGFVPEGAGGRVNEYYPPPPYPPANWKPPDPVPGAPPVPAGAVAAVEVAIRYLETVNKAINICIDLDAM
jgi:hypothetical protein